MTIRKYTRNKEESEKAIERYLCKRIKEHGGLCLKYVNPSAGGYPDRMILFRGLPEIWAEIKSKGEHPSPLQSARISRLREDFGRTVHVLHSKEEVENLLKRLREEHVFKEVIYKNEI